MVAAAEQRPAGEHLGEDAAHSPEVDGVGVLAAAEEDLWGAVPPSGHVLRQGRVVADSTLRVRAREPKVRDAHFAVGVDEEVGGLEIPVNDAGGVNVLETPQQLE